MKTTMVLKAELAPQTNYADGLNAADNPLAVKHSETPDCANVHSNVFGSVEKRRGSAKLNTSALTETVCHNLFDFEVSPSSRKFMAIFDDKLYKMDDLDGTWDSVTLTVAIGDTRAEIRKYGSLAVIASHNGSANIQSWNGSDAATSTISGAAAFKHIWADENTGKLWACGLASNEGIAYYSGLHSVTMDTTNNKIQLADKDTLVGFRSLKGRLYAMGRLGWYRIDDLGGSPAYGGRFVAGPGTFSPESAQLASIDGVGEGIIYLDTAKQLRFFTGLTCIRLSWKFDHRSTFSSAHTLDRINGAQFGDVHAVVYPNRNWYMLYYPEDSDNNNENVMVYDLNAKSAWPFTNVHAGHAAVVWDSNLTTRLYHGGYTGYVWRFDTGSDDDGAAIPSHYDFSRKPSGEDVTRRGGRIKWRQGAFTVKQTGLFTLTLKARTDFTTGWLTLKEIDLSGGGTTLGTFILGQDTLGGVEGLIDVTRIDLLGKHLQMRLEDNSTNPAWQLFGDELAVTSVGAY